VRIATATETGHSWNGKALDTDIPDHATDTYLTQRPGASRGPRAPKNLSKGTHHHD